MSPVQRTLLAIAAFVAIALGMFIWFIANWDKSKTHPIGYQLEQNKATAALFILPNKLRGPGQRPGPALTNSGIPT